MRTYIVGAIGLITALALLGLYLWGSAGWKRFDALSSQAGTVLIALRSASDNPDLKWKDAPGQAIALGESVKDMKAQTATQNQRINDMAAEAIRLRSEASVLREIVRKAKAQRRASVSRLSDLTISPGTREDCMTLLKEAEEALDLAREAGA